MFSLVFSLTCKLSGEHRDSIKFYFKTENLVLRARSESFGFAEIENKDRMFGTKAQRHKGTKAKSKNQKTLLNNKLK